MSKISTQQTERTVDIESLIHELTHSFSQIREMHTTVKSIVNQLSDYGYSKERIAETLRDFHFHEIEFIKGVDINERN